MRFSLQTLRPILAALGVFALMAAAGVYLIVSEFSLVVRLLAAAGVLLLGMVVALDPEDVLRRLTAQRMLYSGNTAVMVVAFIGILAVLNALGTRFSERWDLTASGQYTLSEKTTDILARLDQPIKVTGFFQNEDSRKREAEDLLKEYRVRSDGKIESEFVDPELEPARAISAGVRDEGTLVFQLGDKRQTTAGVSEQEFTTVLLKLTRPERKKVYFTQGHGERSLEAADQNGYSQVKTALDQDNVEVKTVNLMTEQKVPADAAVLVIAGPAKDFLDEEKQAIKDFLAGGGKLLLLQDPRVNMSLDDLFTQWKLSVGKDPVVDPSSAFLGDAGVPVVQQYGFHPITENMRVASFFPFVASVSYPKERIEGVSMVPLAESTERSWVETDPQAARFDEGKDTRGPVAIALVLEAGASNPERATDAGQPSKPRKTRVVIFGDSDFVANNFLRVPSGNLDLFLNSVNWLAESEELITIRPKERDNRQMFLTGTQFNLILVTSTIFLPLAVAVAGVAVWWTRR
ncbi:MAG: GldG family protein [Chloroflexi bacterium]|nr:GldG family protein [Chloroflexota bacterium]